MTNKYGLFRTIPAWDIKNEGYFKDKMLETFERVIRGFMDHDFHIREIEAMDVGLDNWQLPSDTHSNWSGTSWVNMPLTQHEAVGIYGVSSATNTLAVRKLVFKRGFAGNTIIGRNDLSSLKAFETALQAIRECKDQEWLQETFGIVEKLRMEGYFQEMYVFRPLDYIGIGTIYYPQTELGELKLMGYVAEAVGKSIA